MLIIVYCSIQLDSASGRMRGMLNFQRYSRNRIQCLYGEIVRTNTISLYVLAISTKDADIAYGYILYNFEDVSPSDSELITALKSVWSVICGKEETLLKTKRRCLFSYRV